jgi:hypothetical protein
MLETKVLKKKALDKELTLTVSKIGMNSRIIVEFRHISGKMVRQKTFQDTFEGRAEADKFSKSIKNTKELRKYFGLGDNE